MFKTRKWFSLLICVVIILGVTAFLPKAAGAQPGGSLSILDGVFVDTSTGNTYTLSIVANESYNTIGSGRVTILIDGPGASLCSAHGANAEIDFSVGGDDFSGNYPLQTIQCGTMYSTISSIDGCTATNETHGFVHSDPPFISYMGPVPVDFSFRKSAQTDTGTVNIKFYTPKGLVKLSGSLNGTILMDTCN